jgi:superfamily I DNA and/or RNA helicase
MPKQYYQALFPVDKVDGIAYQARKTLDPYKEYLNNVISEIKKRQTIKVRHEEVESLYFVIEPDFTKIRINTNQVLSVYLDEWFILSDTPKEIELVKQKLSSVDGDQDITIEDAIVCDNTTYVLLDTAPDKNDCFYFRKLRNFEVQFNRIENIENLKIENVNIDNYELHDNVISIKTDIDMSSHPRIVINNVINIFNYEIKFFGRDNIKCRGKDLKVLKVNGPILYTEKMNDPIRLTDDKGNEVAFEKINQEIPRIYKNSDENEYEFNKSPKGNFYNLVGLTRFDNDELTLYNDNLPYKIKNTNQFNADEVRVRLIEDETEDNEESVSKSNIEYFFEDGVTEVEDRTVKPYKKYDIAKQHKETWTFSLKSKDRNKPLKYKELPEFLYLPTNTYQLQVQRHAVSDLLNKPIQSHKKLLALTQNKLSNLSTWDSFIPKQLNEDEWLVLIDRTREGNNDQRDFVTKALATPDFAFLEGPPGSGKTTAILELILQILKDGKRVLLSASTHVAIDNVLERIIKYRDRINIFPIRIGNEDNVFNDQLKQMVLTNLIPNTSDNEFTDVILKASNLVCGTTIGILQHPHFKRDFIKGENGSYPEPVDADFDYLIIDESSKTTFQEFLVPALRARKWVLVGDIKQLPPYTEDLDIKVNFSEAIGDKANANLILGLLLQKYRGKDLKVCFVLGNRDYNYLYDEITARKLSIDDFDKKIKYLFLDSTGTLNSIDVDRQLNLNGPNFMNESHLLHAYDIIFIKSDDAERFISYVPSYFKVITLETSTYKKTYVKRHIYQEKYIEEVLKEYISSMSEGDEFKKDLSEDWASYITWRIKRDFELRDVKTKRQIIDQARPFFPKNNEDKFAKKYEEIYQIALPSILESLQKGIKTNSDNIKKNPTIINEGFPLEIFNLRHTILTYQHRMHPEISTFSRSTFYNNQALIDSKHVINRVWGYSEYPSCAVWIDVKPSGRYITRSSNQNEVYIMINELDKFLSWAAKHPKFGSDGKIEFYEVACLTFYRKQESNIREELRKKPNQRDRKSQFIFKEFNTKVVLYTIDKFQGREADITFISMVRNGSSGKVGFLDSPNRLNVAMTRARYQRVIIGDMNFFLNQRMSEPLRKLSEFSKRLEVKI